MTENTDSDNETYYLDEKEELYEWGILNVHQNQFCTPLGHGSVGTEADIFMEKNTALDDFGELADQQDSTRNLRIVKVEIDNASDREVVENTEDGI